MRHSLSPKSVEMLSLQGALYFQGQKYANAEQCFVQALDLLDIPSLADDEGIATKAATTSDDVESSLKTKQKDGIESSPLAEYDEGMCTYRVPLPFDETITTQNSMVATLSYNIGQMRLHQGSLDGARSAFIKALKYCDMTSNDLPKLYVRIVSCIGYCAYKGGKEEEAIKAYENAIVVASRLHLETRYLAAAFNSVGVLMFNNKCPSEEVLEIFQKSLRNYNHHDDTSNPFAFEIATVLNNIGRVYYLRSDFDKALGTYQEALRIRRRLGNQALDVAATLYNIGQTYQRLKQPKMALTCFMEFFEIVRSCYGDKSKDVALGYKCIGEANNEMGDFKTAHQYYSLALEVQEVVTGRLSTEAATIINKLGNLSYEMKDFRSALRYYWSGLLIEETILPQGHEHILITLANIAHIYKQLGDYSKALAAYTKVYQLQKTGKVLSESPANFCQLAETLSSIGLMEYHLRNYEVSLDAYQEALRLRRQHYKTDDHPDIASTLNSIGLVLFKQDMFELAMQCFTESLRIRSKTFGGEHRDVAVLWYNIATVHFETGQEESAVKMYEETLRVERISLGHEHPDVVLTLQHIGQVYQQLGQVERAIEYFREALEVERKHSDSQGKKLGRLLNLLGNAYLQLGRVSEMMDCFVEASRIFQANKETGEALMIAGYNFYGLSKTNPPCAHVA